MRQRLFLVSAVIGQYPIDPISPIGIAQGDAGRFEQHRGGPGVLSSGKSIAGDCRRYA
jgi:hypothetical protein